MVEVLLNRITMKFHENLTKEKTERDISKNWNLKKLHFSMTELQLEKHID